MKRHILLSLATLVGVTRILSSPLPAPQLKISYSDAVPDAPETGGHRERRSYSGLHNYIETVFDMIQDEKGNPGQWKLENCNSPFNCGSTVSPHYCSDPSNIAFYCSDNDETEDCSFSFSFGFDPKNHLYRDMDLSLYKAKEANPFTFYTVYIIYLVSPTNGYIVSSATIISDCDGWLIFHLHDYVSWTLHNGTNHLQFRILVYKDGQIGMTCSQISNIFLMNAAYGEVGSGEDNYSILEEKPTAEATVAVTSQAFSLPYNELIDYIPIMTIFTTDSGRKKRDIANTGMRSTDIRSRKRCRRVDRLVPLDSIWIEGEQYSVLHPVTYNVGECKHESEDGDDDSVSKQHCVPTRFKSIELLVRKMTDSRHYALHRNSDTIVDECGLSSSFHH